MDEKKEILEEAKKEDFLTEEELEEEVKDSKKKSSLIKRLLKKTFLYRKVYRSIVKIRRVVNEPSMFPEYERKSKFKRYYENY